MSHKKHHEEHKKEHHHKEKGHMAVKTKVAHKDGEHGKKHHKMK